MSRDINNNECKIIHYLHNHFWLFCVYNVILGTMFLFLIQVSVQSSINKYGTTEKTTICTPPKDYIIEEGIIVERIETRPSKLKRFASTFASENLIVDIHYKIKYVKD